MAGTSLIALIDDIASVLDDVALLTKVAAKKTSGVLGDDLALNAQQVAGVRADRELPVVWAVARGSMRNKLILVPAALLISAFAPWAVTPLLMAGGVYLCFEGVEKLAHRMLAAPGDADAAHTELLRAVADPALDLVEFEREKIRGAIRTDLILSAEIITIAMGTVAAESFPVRVGVLAGIALLMTVGVYGFVALIVKLDDAGLALIRSEGTRLVDSLRRWLGATILAAAPWLMKLLSVAGTAAMFLVGGGILTHGLPVVHHWIAELTAAAAAVTLGGPLLGALAPLLADGVAGVTAGALALAVVRLVRRGAGAH